MTFFLVIFCLATAIGAWQVWCRSPVYSARLSLQFAGIFLLTILVILGLARIVTSGAVRGLPVPLSVGLMVLGALLAAMGCCALILRLSDGYFVKLPASIPRVKVHRRRFYPWFRRTGAAVLLAAAVSPFLSPDGRILLLVLGGFLLFLWSIILLSLYAKAGRYDRGLSQLLADFWVHWQYTAEEWALWEAAERAREQSKPPAFLWSRDWRIVPFVALPIAVAFALGQGWPGRLAIFSATTAVLVLGFAAIVWVFNKTRKGFLPVPEDSRDTYFGPGGLLFAGQYLPWILSGSYLVAAGTDPGPPPHLVLSFEVFNGRYYSVVEKRILMPRGASDLELLERYVRSACPKADIRLGHG